MLLRREPLWQPMRHPPRHRHVDNDSGLAPNDSGEQRLHQQLEWESLQLLLWRWNVCCCCGGGAGLLCCTLPPEHSLHAAVLVRTLCPQYGPPDPRPPTVQERAELHALRWESVGRGVGGVCAVARVAGERRPRAHSGGVSSDGRRWQQQTGVATRSRHCRCLPSTLLWQGRRAQRLLAATSSCRCAPPRLNDPTAAHMGSGGLAAAAATRGSGRRGGAERGGAGCSGTGGVGARWRQRLSVR